MGIRNGKTKKLFKNKYCDACCVTVSTIIFSCLDFQETTCLKSSGNSVSAYKQPDMAARALLQKNDIFYEPCADSFSLVRIDKNSKERKLLKIDIGALAGEAHEKRTKTRCA